MCLLSSLLPVHAQLAIKGGTLGGKKVLLTCMMDDQSTEDNVIGKFEVVRIRVDSTALTFHPLFFFFFFPENRSQTTVRRGRKSWTQSNDVIEFCPLQVHLHHRSSFSITLTHPSRPLFSRS